MNAALDGNALFPALLGAAFQRLDPAVQVIHGGAGGSWRGVASVRRSTRLLARCIAWLAGMPAAVEAAPVHVTIEPIGARERWTRIFGGGLALRSTLRSRNGLLVERMGIASLSFRLSESGGGIDWQLVGIAALGIPLPLNWFRVSARSGADPQGYRFVVGAGIARLGDFIAYEGGLHVER